MRGFVSVVLGMWWTAALGLLILRWWDAGGVVPIVQAGLPLVGLSLLPLLLLAMLLRHRMIVAATTLLMLPMLVLALPWWVDDGTVPRGPDDVTVLMSNTLYGRADLAQLEDAVGTLDVDALVLLEVTPDFLTQLNASGIPDALPHRSGRARTDAGGTLVLTAEAHTPVSAPAPTVFDQVAVKVGDGQAQWTLLAAHPPPPIMDQDWRAELALLGSWVDDQPDDTPLVLAGDFNASTAQPAYRAAFGELTDPHRATGAGWVRTWPQASRIPPFTHLDHVLVRDAGVVSAGQISVDGSDHQAVWARIAVHR